MNQRVRRLLTAFAGLMSVTLCFAFTATAQEMAAHHHIGFRVRCGTGQHAAATGLGQSAFG